MPQIEVDLELIKQRRNDLGISQKEMASSLGLRAIEKYSRRESGEYKFQATEIPLLARQLKIPIEKIFKKSLRI